MNDSRPRTVSLAVDTEEARNHLSAIEGSRTRHELTAAVLNALAYIPALSAEVDRLYSLLADERLRYANLLAAVRAALDAARTGRLTRSPICASTFPRHLGSGAVETTGMLPASQAGPSAANTFATRCR
jgi:hypothetical protein